MANDGGPAYPIQGLQMDGMSVRDAFAKEIAAHLYPTVDSTSNAALASEVYDFAQMLTDEKLKRDKADRDEGEQAE